MTDQLATAAPIDDFESLVESFERRRFDGEALGVVDVLPEGSPDRRAAVACELVRIDLEIARARGEGRTIDDYRASLPELFARPELLALVAFEEWRLRREAGERPSRDEYLERYGLPPSVWPSAGREDGAPAPAYPRVGDKFDGMPLERVLGAGAFSRVYVARQPRFGDRRVVLKVTADASIEPQRLGRLQHTNVVPLYSAHRDHGLLGLCMPLLGERTLEHLLHRGVRDEGAVTTVAVANAPTIEGRCDLSAAPARPAPAEPDRVPWRDAATIVADLADGLQHAHDRGLVHGDVKPANVLFGDDDVARLLDFNLSSDSSVADPTTLVVGGTLPYLAPEHLEALVSGDRVTPSCDVYSLGVVLYELVAGRPPFPHRSGTLPDLAVAMRGDRVAGAAPLAAAPAGLAAIVAKCLAPEATERYSSAAEFGAELRRELNDQPLAATRVPSLAHRFAKWRRRNRGALLRAAVGLGCLASFAGLLYAASQTELAESLRATQAVAEFDRLANVARMNLCVPDIDGDVERDGMAAIAESFDALKLAADHPSPIVARLAQGERDRVALGVSELVLLAEGRDGGESLRRDRLTASFAPWGLQISLDGASEHGASEHGASEHGASIDHAFGEALALLREGDAKRADIVLEAALNERGGDPALWLERGVARASLGDSPGARECFTAAIALAPRASAVWRHRAYAAIDEGRFAEALADLDRAEPSARRSSEVRLNRAIALAGLRRWDEAAESATEAIALGAERPRAYLLRARCHDATGKGADADRDRQKAASTEPIDDQDWAAKAIALTDGDAERALAELDRGLAAFPRSVVLLRNRVHLLGDVLHREQEAAEATSRLLGVLPEDPAALLGRAVCNARLGNDQQALADAGLAEALKLRPIDHMQLACVHSLLAPRDAARVEDAVRLLRVSIGAEPRLAARASRDPDLAPVLDDKRVERLLAAALSFEEASR
ncbi:MAG: protein kinase domain-containing protein [Lacipirellulaceae bacterium]